MDAPFRSSEPLEGLFGNLHNVVPLLIAAAVWFVATWKKLRRKPDAAAPLPPEEAERTRRVQEEIRRKIAARRGEAPLLDPLGGPSARPRSFMPAAEPPVEAWPAPPTAEEQAAQARQERLAAQVQALEAAAAARPRAPRAAEAPALPPMVSPWLAELRDPASFRRAMVLREVLGAPVALR